MSDDFLTQTRPMAARPAPRTGKTMLIVALLAFAMGAALVGWLAWKGMLTIGERRAAEPKMAIVDRPATALPAITASPTTPGMLPSPAPTAAQSVGEAVLDQRMVSLEDRLTRLDLQAQAAAGNAARAEGLLIALAARRAIERGVPLGYLEDQLKLRFGAAQPNAVQTILATARQPVTLDRLVGQFDALAPKLAQRSEQKSGWGAFREQITDLFTIRRDSAPAANLQDRLDQARLLLQTGQVEAAARTVEQTPGAAQARDWLGSARRYTATAQALDLIETTAILEPRELQDNAGVKVNQPSPLAGPTA